jgi:hypothetical protein
MSDDDFMADSGEEFDFEYESDADPGDDTDADLENLQVSAGMLRAVVL